MLYFKGSIKHIRNGPTQTQPFILLLDVTTSDNTLFREHVWIKWSKRLSRFSRGDRIQFSADVETYTSSTGGNLGLKHIRNITLI